MGADLKVIRGIGGARLEITIQERDEKEALLRALFYCEPDRCGNCGNVDGIAWSAHRAKSDKGKFTYITRTCPKCKHCSEAGTYQDGGFFWKRWTPARQRQTEEP